MREVFLGLPWGCSFLPDLITHTSALPRVYARIRGEAHGQGTRSSGIQATLSEVQDNLATLEASHAKQSGELSQVERQRNNLTGRLRHSKRHVPHLSNP